MSVIVSQSVYVEFTIYLRNQFPPFVPTQMLLERNARLTVRKKQRQTGIQQKVSSNPDVVLIIA